jgi:hypothetical protein
MKILKNIVLLTIISAILSVANAAVDPVDKKAIHLEISKVLNEAEVYPNPAEDYVYLKINEISSSTEVEIEVMSIIGNKMNINHERIESGLYKINIKNIPAGHYYVMLTIDSKKSLKKFLKK